MAISAYDVRGTFAWPALVLPSRGTPASGTARRRLPVTALLAGLIGIVEAIGLLAVALHALDGLLTSSRTAGPVLALSLVGLAGWIVLAAGGGAAVVDGAGRRLLVGVAVAELGLVVLVGALAAVTPIPVPMGLPLSGLLLLAAAVPAGKLLLAGSPSTVTWLAGGPRAVERRPDPAAGHRVLATATLGVIGLTLGAVALLGPVEDSVRTGETASTSVYQPVYQP